MKPEREKEFKELSDFLKYYATNIWGMPIDDKIHPYNCLIENIEKHGKSQAFEGLKQGINDYIEHSSDWDFSKVNSFDQLLKEENIITLSEIRKRYWSKYKRIIKNNAIKNESEYCMIKGIILDSSFQIEINEKQIIEEILIEYENKIGKS